MATRPLILSAFASAALFLVMGAAGAFFDEVVSLREELQVWEQANAADFEEVIAQLEDITGTVFSDVNDADWFNPYIASLAEWNIVSGLKDGSGRPTGEFKPGNQVTVAEVLKMSLEAAGVDTSQCPPLPAHPEAANHWSKQYVSCAESMGIRIFHPSIRASLNRPARRAEVVTVIHDAFDESVLPLYSNFSDTGGHVFEADVAMAAYNGIVSGDKDVSGVATGTFRPNEPIVRAEAAKVIYEQLKLTTMREEVL